jgi:hypothetical protein
VKFNGDSGRRPQAEARRYVYSVLATMLDHELSPEAYDGWIFGGIKFDPDKRRLRRAVKAVIVEMRRKAKS